MANSIDLSKDPFFIKELARARRIGEVKGREMSRIEGLIDAYAAAFVNVKGQPSTKKNLIIAILQTNKLSLESIANLANEPLEFVLEVQKQFLAKKKGKKMNK
jgi:hypothetical protein